MCDPLKRHQKLNYTLNIMPNMSCKLRISWDQFHKVRVLLWTANPHSPLITGLFCTFSSPAAAVAVVSSETAGMSTLLINHPFSQPEGQTVELASPPGSYFHHSCKKFWTADLCSTHITGLSSYIFSYRYIRSIASMQILV